MRFVRAAERHEFLVSTCRVPQDFVDFVPLNLNAPTDKNGLFFGHIVFDELITALIIQRLVLTIPVRSSNFRRGRDEH
jgi:hypothetical protein